MKKIGAESWAEIIHIIDESTAIKRNHEPLGLVNIWMESIIICSDIFRYLIMSILTVIGALTNLANTLAYFNTSSI